MPKGVLIDPLTKTIRECELPAGEYQTPVGSHTLELGYERYFVFEGHPNPIRGQAFVPNLTLDEAQELVDFGEAQQVGNTMMFFGNVNIREIKP